MKLRLKTKDNHHGERIRLKGQTFARCNISSLLTLLERNLQTYTRLKSDIFIRQTPF